MKRFLLLFFLGLFACTLPVAVGISTPVPTSTPLAVPTPTVTPQPTLPPGSVKNPLLLALAPSAQPAADVITAANELTVKLEALTGYHYVVVAPPSEAGLVKLLNAGNVNIAALSPLAYILAHNNGARAALASTKKGEAFYGAQFIARASDNYDAFFDPTRAENTADAPKALSQFRDKKPCWSDPESSSGYVIPLGVLNQAKIQTRPGAFVEGQTTVVRAVYVGGICDFGATYIDARENPALEADYPDVKDRVEVIWRVPAIIPYDLIVFSASVTPDVERSLLRAFVDLMNTTDGKALVQKIYGMDELQIVQDAMYDDFRSYVKDSGVDLGELVK